MKLSVSDPFPTKRGFQWANYKVLGITFIRRKGAQSQFIHFYSSLPCSGGLDWSNVLLYPKSVFPSTECNIDPKNQAKLQHVCFEIGAEADLKNKAFLRREVEQEAKGEVLSGRGSGKRRHACQIYIISCSRYCFRILTPIKFERQMKLVFSNLWDDNLSCRNAIWTRI